MCVPYLYVICLWQWDKPEELLVFEQQQQSQIPLAVSSNPVSIKSQYVASDLINLVEKKFLISLYLVP